MATKIFVISPDKDLVDVLGDLKPALGTSATLFRSEEELFKAYKDIEALRGPRVIEHRDITDMDVVKRVIKLMEDKDAFNLLLVKVGFQGSTTHWNLEERP